MQTEMAGTNPTGGPLIQTIPLEYVHMGHHGQHGHQKFPNYEERVRSDHSILSSLKSDLSLGLSDCSGPPRHPARLDLLHTPVLGGLLGLDETKCAIRRLEDTPDRLLPIRPAQYTGKMPSPPPPETVTAQPAVAEEPLTVECSTENPSIVLPSALSSKIVKQSVTEMPSDFESYRDLSEQSSETRNPSNLSVLSPNLDTPTHEIVLAEHVDLSPVDSNDIHVFADPPLLEDSVSDISGFSGMSLRRRANKVVRSYGKDLHSIEGDSEEWHNERRDRAVQDIRNAEMHHTDSDSFHLRLTPAPTQAVTEAEVMEVKRDENGHPHRKVSPSSHVVYGAIPPPLQPTGTSSPPHLLSLAHTEALMGGVAHLSPTARGAGPPSTVSVSPSVKHLVGDLVGSAAHAGALPHDTDSPVVNEFPRNERSVPKERR